MSDNITQNDQASILSSAHSSSYLDTDSAAGGADDQISTDPPADPSLYDWVDWTRLKGYCMPHTATRFRTWSWNEHAVEIMKQSDKSRHWLCKECHIRKAHIPHIMVSSGTGNHQNHLLQHHPHIKPPQNWQGKPVLKRKRPQANTIEAALVNLSASRPNEQRALNAIISTFNPDYFKALLLRWITLDNIAFLKLESQNFRDLMEYANSAIIDNRCLSTHTTTRRLIIEAYQQFKLEVVRLIKESPYRIHYSFDIWTSRKNKAFMGIIAHFFDKDLKHREFLLSLPNLSVSHEGKNMAELATAILKEFDISPSQLSYFCGDNASNNDTALQELGEEWGFNKDWCRLRCLGHIFNLVARSLIFGMDPDGVEEDLAKTREQLQELQTEFEIWLKFGPIGKLHICLIWITRGNRIEEFKRVQKAVLAEQGAEDIGKVYEIILANDTRWNSNLAEFKRGYQLRLAIDRYIGRHVREWNEYRNKVTDHGKKNLPDKHRKKPPVVDAQMTDDDWDVIQKYIDILEPIREATDIMQGRQKNGKYGSAAEVLVAIEWLLDHLEEKKFLYANDKTAEILGVDNTANKMLINNINQAWLTAEKWYQATDDTPVYISGVVLDPTRKWKHVDKEWVGKYAKREKAAARQRVQEFWEQYKALPLPNQAAASSPSTSPPSPVHRKRLRESTSSFAERLHPRPATPSEDEEEELDEYAQYLARGNNNKEDRACTDIIAYWKGKKDLWPRLSHMALDIYSAPAMSTECERIFSLAGLLITCARNRLREDIIGAQLCLASWQRAGVIDLRRGISRTR